MKSVVRDTRPFEIAAEFSSDGRLNSDCVQRIAHTLDRFGFVIVVDLLTDREAQQGLDIILETLSDPIRAKGSFASRVDNNYKRRDFCPLASTEPVLSFVSMLCKKLGKIVDQYCDTTKPIIEVSTLTSYFGSSHQYVHRDFWDIISVLAAVEDVSDEQGGTLFIPSTHKSNKKTWEVMSAYGTLLNLRIFYHNLGKMLRMRKSLAVGELRARLISRNFDSHQPNLSSFLSKSGNHVNLFMVFKDLWRFYKFRKQFRAYDCVQVSPKKGTVVLYFSEIMHAGPDNQSDKPRHFLSLNLARSTLSREVPNNRYTPHPSFVAEPKTLDQVLDL